MRRAAHVEIEIDTSMRAQGRSNDMESSDDVLLLPTSHLQVLPSHRDTQIPIGDQSDIERYSGLIKKISRNSTDVHCAIYPNLGSNVERGNSSRTLINIPEQARTRQDDIQYNSVDEKPLPQLQPPDTSAAMARTGFSFRSIKSGIFSRLFGSQSLGDIGGSTSFLRPNSSIQNRHEGSTRPNEHRRGDSAGPADIPSLLHHRPEDRLEEGAYKDISTNRNMPAKSGGILSNLLKLQALSVPTSSRHHRRKRHHQHQHRRHKNTAWKPSTGSELTSTKSAPYILSSPSGSVATLPGNLISVGPATNVGSSSAVATIPHPGVDHDTIVTDPGLGAMKAQQNGYRGRAFSDTISCSPSTLMEENLIPEQVGGDSRFLQAGRAYSARSSISADDATSMYSSISQDPLVAAMRLNQQAELAETVANILLRQELLIRLCKSFIRYGAPSHRIETAMETMCKTFGVDGSFAFLPGLMMISFGDPDTHTSETHLIKCAQGFDVGRLAKVHKIVRALVNGDVDPGEALTTLKAISSEMPLYNTWIFLLCSALCSGLAAPILFGGSWFDMLASMGLGTVVGLTTLLANKHSIYSSVFEVSTSILIAFVAKALRDYVCFTGVVLSGIMILLPGLQLTTAIMELSSRYMISGSVRMFYSLIYCLFLGYGLSIGSNLYDVFREPAPGDLRMGNCHASPEPWRWALLPLLGISLGVVLGATPRQWPALVIISSVGFAVSEMAGLYWPHALHIAAAVSAFVVGLLGNVYERITHEL
ncbi:hypothetical protein BGZ99_000924, partial [Dissophora globulifera]